MARTKNKSVFLLEDKRLVTLELQADAPNAVPLSFATPYVCHQQLSLNDSEKERTRGLESIFL